MRLVVGMSGASGAMYGIRVLEVLKRAGVETHLVMSNSARRTVALGTDYGVDNVLKLATHVHDVDDVGACISSGSFKHDGMVIAPCSIKTLSAVAKSFNSKDEMINELVNKALEQFGMDVNTDLEDPSGPWTQRRG